MTPPLPATIKADQDRAARIRQYELNRRYYRGDHQLLRDARRGTKPAPRNYTGLFVDTIAAHMGRASVNFGDGKTPNTLDSFVETTLAAEDIEQLDFDAELACSIDGDAAFKVTWDDVERRVRVVNVDAATLWVRGRPDDPNTTEIVAQQYMIRPEDFPVMFPGRVIRTARAAIATEAWTIDRWQIWLDGDLELDEPNPYGFNPYVIYPNIRQPGQTWGTGDPERLIRLQDRLNQATHDRDMLMRVAGNVVILENVTGGDDIAVVPGAIWDLPEGAKAYILDMLQGNLIGQHLAHTNEIRASLHDIARVPATALGNTGRTLSGAALAKELQPLVRLVARKRLSRSAALRRRAELIVALGAKYAGLADRPDRPPSVVWTDPIPSDRADDLANAQAEISLGRDLEAVLSEIGVEDPPAELRARARQIREGLGGPIGTTGKPQPTDPAAAAAGSD